MTFLTDPQKVLNGLRGIMDDLAMLDVRKGV